jgi:hypothetical protein
MRAVSSFACLLCLCLAWAESASAQGLIHQLPPDGTSVRYSVAVTRKGPGGEASNVAVDVTVSSVGVLKGSDGDLRWIEISLRLPEQSQLLKLAIPEKRFGKGQDPFAHIARAWLKRSDAEPEQVEPDRARRAVAVFLAPHFDKLTGEGSDTLDTKIGKLECTVREGKTTATFDNTTMESTGRFWLSSQAPFGWAQLELHRRSMRGGELVRESTSRFTIAEVRRQAVSALPERP